MLFKIPSHSILKSIVLVEILLVSGLAVSCKESSGTAKKTTVTLKKTTTTPGAATPSADQTQTATTGTTPNPIDNGITSDDIDNLTTDQIIAKIAPDSDLDKQYGYTAYTTCTVSCHFSGNARIPVKFDKDILPKLDAAMVTATHKNVTMYFKDPYRKILERAIVRGPKVLPSSKP